ncbi:MAG: hypothetical protein GY863_20455 [bacterium]|nr:hypothetical protein [bacterium]
MFKKITVVLSLIFLILNINCGIISEDQQDYEKSNNELFQRAYFLNEVVVSLDPKLPDEFSIEEIEKTDSYTRLKLSGLEMIVIQTEDGEYFLGKAEKFDIVLEQRTVNDKIVSRLVSISDNVKYKQVYGDGVYDWYKESNR